MADNSWSPVASLAEVAPASSRDFEAEETKRQNATRQESMTSSSKHWRKLRTAVAALAAFRSRKVKALDFERVHLCGEGGSGLVYLVRLKSTTLYFALKVQRKQDLQSKERRIRRALIEREVLVTCAHPFVCNLYTAFQDSRHLYLLMDYCAGGDLASFIRNVVGRTLTEEEARFFSSEIVAALEWIHLHGFVYRDLKPENVLVHESGHIRLGDFGTAERGSAWKSQRRVDKVSREEVETALDASVESGDDDGQEMNILPIGKTPSKLRSSDQSLREGERNSVEDGGPEDLEQVNRRLCTVSVHVDPLLAESIPVHGAATDTRHPADGRGQSPAHGAQVSFSPPEPRPSEFLKRGGSRGTDGVDVRCLWSRPKTDSQPQRGFRSTRAMAMEESATRGPPRRARRRWMDICRMRRIMKPDSSSTKPLRARPPKQDQQHDAGGNDNDNIFSNGRGSVKLNVLLDSQTFIGTADFMSPEMVTGKERQGTAMDWWALGVMVYEMTLGRLPFNSHLVETDEGLFRSIVNADVAFPRGHFLTDAAVDFIRELLRKEPSERLGTRQGVGEIKRHPFFKDVHWALIAYRKAPFQVQGPDTAGWAMSMEQRLGDDKMATWTWQHTTDAARPHMQQEDAAPDLSVSGRNSFSLHSNGVGVGELGSDGLVSMNFEEGTGMQHGRDDGMAMEVRISHDSEDEGSGGADGDMGGGGDGGGDDGGDGGGEKRPGHSSNTFDGYDFNTMHKVGSFVLGMGPVQPQGATRSASRRQPRRPSSAAPGHGNRKRTQSC